MIDLPYCITSFIAYEIGLRTICNKWGFTVEVKASFKWVKKIICPFLAGVEKSSPAQKMWNVAHSAIHDTCVLKVMENAPSPLRNRYRQSFVKRFLKHPHDGNPKQALYATKRLNAIKRQGVDLCVTFSSLDRATLVILNNIGRINFASDAIPATRLHS